MLSATILSLCLIESVQPVSLPLFFFLYSKLSPLAVRPGFLFGVMKSLNQATPLNLKTLSQRVSNLVFCYNHLGASNKGVISGSPPEDSEGTDLGCVLSTRVIEGSFGDSPAQHSWEADLYQPWAATRSPGQDHLTPCGQILFLGVGDTSIHTHTPNVSV